MCQGYTPVVSAAATRAGFRMHLENMQIAISSDGLFLPPDHRIVSVPTDRQDRLQECVKDD